MSNPILQVIVASVRPTRIGEAVGDWFIPIAEAHGGFAVERVDLRELALPLLDEPHHPMKQSIRTSIRSAGAQRSIVVTPMCL